MAEMRAKLGCYASEPRLLHFLRMSRGKVHWAVNSFLREMLSRPPARGQREDFDYLPDGPVVLPAELSSRESLPEGMAAVADARVDSVVPCAAAPSSGAAGSGSEAGLPCGLTALSPAILEEVLKKAGYQAVCCVAQACSVLQKVWVPPCSWRCCCCSLLRSAPLLCCCLKIIPWQCNRARHALCAAVLN